MIRQIKKNVLKNKKAAQFFNIAKVLTCFALASTISLTPAYAQQIITDGNTNTTLNINGIVTNITTTTTKGNNAFNSFSKFNVNAGNTVNLHVPSSSNNLINLVHEETTQINGILNSIKDGHIGGNIFLANPHGIVVGSTGVINVGSLTAVTPTVDFMNNFFTAPGMPADASINALLNGTAPINHDGEISNHGIINAITNVKLDTGSVTNTGDIYSGAVFQENDIALGDVVNINTLENATNIDINGSNITIKVANNIALDNETLIQSKSGSVNLEAGFVSTAGLIDTSGSTGGTIDINAGTLSLAGNLFSKGFAGPGGLVNLNVAGKTWETTSSTIDVSGLSGGSINHIAGQQITTSGNYFAVGNNANGGEINITAPALKFLSTQIDASGKIDGGYIQLGGEYQGGKNLEQDIIPNAQTLVMTDSTMVSADSTGNDGNAGTIITWADQEAIVLGEFSAKPGLESGEGGFVEVSSGDILTFGGKAKTGVNERTGTLLLDPKDITIAAPGYSQYGLIIGYDYCYDYANNINLDSNDYFGSSVSLDGNRLAVGAYNDYGYNNSLNYSGAVYLYSFTDSAFNGGALEGIIGSGYTGNKNINQSLDASDYFGSSVSLDGNRLAVGARYDDGVNNLNTNSGAVYLYTFTDSEFTGGTLQSLIGSGYTGNKNINQSLDEYDYFGRSVSLDGNRLAVGSSLDCGFNNSGSYYGAVYLYSFTDSAFNGGALQGIIGRGYTDNKNINQSLGSNDYFGSSVSLDGNRLAVGAYNDDGYNNSLDSSGCVYLYSFTDSAFSGGALQGIIGSGYTDNKNINQSLDGSDFFGGAISLDGNSLAVGAYGDDGYNNSLDGSGCVYLYSFTDSTFSGGALQGIIGSGYTGGKNINQTLDTNDNFGIAVSLDDNRLAVGAYRDDGYNNSLYDSGAVYLYSFTDSAFSGGALQGIIGSGYTGNNNNNNITQSLDNDDYFGGAVSLDGNNLAVGAYGDDGFENALSYSGAVYLYTFTDSEFSGGALQSIIGSGYTGGKNINQTLGTSDNFGIAVSLNDNRLAVGARYDDGFNNTKADAGAVYLYTFTDAEFTGGSLQSTIGSGYTGGKNINQTLDAWDQFGRSVSLDGNRLAVGAEGDYGYTNLQSGSGAVYLYTFTDSEFTGGAFQSIIGDGYTGGKNIDQDLDANDFFSRDISLNGNRLAVGAVSDDGFNNLNSNTGAIYLYTFTDTAFTGGALQGIIGSGYTGGKNINQTLDNNDSLYTVSLDDNRLAAGAGGDDGFNNLKSNSGVVYIYNFTDSDFTGGTLEGTLGSGYTGDKNIDVTNLDVDDGFGGAVSLDSGRLAVGVVGDDGYNNTMSLTGAVYLFSGSDAGNYNFNTQPTDNITISNISLAELLSTPQAVILQANNDINVQDEVTVSNPAGTGGALTLQAGRSIYVNSNITSDNGNLNIIANDTLANGVVDAQRDEGDAVITMAPGTIIDAGTGNVTIDLRNGAGKTNTGGGDISLNEVYGNDIYVVNALGNILDNKADETPNIYGRNITLVSSSGTVGTSYLNLQQKYQLIHCWKIRKCFYRKYFRFHCFFDLIYCQQL